MSVQFYSLETILMGALLHDARDMREDDARILPVVILGLRNEENQ
jgi:hypothetical protein